MFILQHTVLKWLKMSLGLAVGGCNVTYISLLVSQNVILLSQSGAVGLRLLPECKATLHFANSNIITVNIWTPCGTSHTYPSKARSGSDSRSVPIIKESWEKTVRQKIPTRMQVHVRCAKSAPSEWHLGRFEDLVESILARAHGVVYVHLMNFKCML